jgi:hypothetical protein
VQTDIYDQLVIPSKLEGGSEMVDKIGMITAATTDSKTLEGSALLFEQNLEENPSLLFELLKQMQSEKKTTCAE